MTYNVKVSPKASQLFIEANEWWVENRPAAPTLVTQETNRILAFLSDSPKIGGQELGAGSLMPDGGCRIDGVLAARNYSVTSALSGVKLRWKVGFRLLGQGAQGFLHVAHAD